MLAGQWRELPARLSLHSNRKRQADGAPHLFMGMAGAIVRDQMGQETKERLAIREVIENWVVWRDAGDWQRFRSVWHTDGYMMATWFQGPAEDFIRVSIEGWNRGVSILHFLGGTSIDLAGTRAIAQTKMTISQRAMVHDVLCDVVCTG